MYYNTTNQSGSLLRWYEEQTDKQEDIVLRFFEEHPGNHSPFDVHFSCLSSAPITSVRRAITNLTKAGKLVKTDHQKMGAYGKPCYTWKLA